MIDEKLIVVGIVLLYYIIGGVLGGLTHRFDPRTFTCDTAIGLTVMAWIIVVPLYFFVLFCDRCIYWFDKKENK